MAQAVERGGERQTNPVKVYQMRKLLAPNAGAIGRSHLQHIITILNDQDQKPNFAMPLRKS